MIDKLRAMAIFANVVEHGSFRAAAQHLGLAPSRVSQSVSDLEKELNITLLYRSTRRLSLTAEGELLFESVTRMLQAAESGLDAINLDTSAPSGELRITAPAFVTQTRMMDTFAAFHKRHRNVMLRLNFSDKPRDLIKEGYDVAIRAGWLKNSELMTRNVGSSERLLVASADYVNSQPAIEDPMGLETWDWIHFTVRPGRTDLINTTTGDQITVQCPHRVEVDSANALYELTIRGLGVSMLPEHLVRENIVNGKLVHLFPDWSLKPLNLCAVWPDKSRRQNLTLIFVRFLAENATQL